MKVKTNELTKAALDWAIAQASGHAVYFKRHKILGYRIYFQANGFRFNPSEDWVAGGEIIEREDISVIRLENKSVPNEKGLWQGVYENQWAAVINMKHSVQTVYGHRGDDFGESYAVDASAIIGGTPLEAAMRCYVASKLGDTVEIPEELING